MWRRVSAFDRSKVMRRAANLLRERADMIAALMTTEQGKPLVEARGETMAGADVIDWFAEEARRSYGRVIPARAEGVYQLVVKEPVGVVAAFTPRNFPINQAVRKTSAALAAYSFTRSAKTANAIAAAVESGMRTINHLGLALPEVPFGGIKDSGYGSEGGTEAIEAYLNTKFVTQAGL